MDEGTLQDFRTTCVPPHTESLASNSRNFSGIAYAGAFPELLNG